MKGDPPSLHLGRNNAETILRDSGLDPSHPHYDFFAKLLTKSLERSSRHTRSFRAYGQAILKLTEGRITRATVAQIRELAEGLCEVELGADIDAIRLIAVGARGQAKQKKGQKAGGQASGRTRRQKYPTDLETAAKLWNGFVAAHGREPRSLVALHEWNDALKCRRLKQLSRYSIRKVARELRKSRP